MKMLNGAELAEFIKERQAKQVRALRQAHNTIPKLVIIRTNPDPVVDSYMRIKQAYGEDIAVEVEVCTVDQKEALNKIIEYNQDSSVHGIIVQIPLPDPSQTDEILNAVSLEKDVDGLAENSKFDAPTPMAIDWLLAGYNVELRNMQIVIVGHGRLVGRPLQKLWQASNYKTTVVDKKTNDLKSTLQEADVIISATGVPGLITSDMVKEKAVIVDAGVATDSNGLVGDVAEDVRSREDLTITPIKGGVGPLTVCGLFENVIRAAQANTQ
jgi:methylenetetrahydrofolate dehydrogenase (NADP+)/methenyltetrahydrofolate cyclohydrolase